MRERERERERERDRKEEKGRNKEKEREDTCKTRVAELVLNKRKWVLVKTFLNCSFLKVAFFIINNFFNLKNLLNVIFFFIRGLQEKHQLNILYVCILNKK
jgi:hypothetical protein